MNSVVRDGVSSVPMLGGLDPAELDDPYPLYERLRRDGALARGGPRQWIVSRYAEVDALLRDPRFGHRFSDAYHRRALGPGLLAEFFARTLLFRDGAEHRRLRRIVGAALRPALAEPPRGRIASHADALLVPALDTGGFDAVADLAAPLPMRVLCETFGFPAEARERIHRLIVDFGRAFATRPGVAALERAGDALESLRVDFATLLDRPPGSDVGDFAARLADAAARDPDLDHEAVIDNAIFALFAGYETTVNLIASTCAELIAHPAELARLHDDPSLAQSGVEEVLRFDAPIQSVARIAHESMEIGGQIVMEGRVLVLLLGSANRDDRRFDAPDRFDVGRRPNPHLSFGAGPHHCLGAPLARAQAEVVIGRLLHNFAALEPAAAIERAPAIEDRVYRRVPIASRRR